MSARVFEPCEKCGHEDIYVTYDSGANSFDRDHLTHGCNRDDRGDEHFHLGCRRCSYKWNEAHPAPTQSPPRPTTTLSEALTIIASIDGPSKVGGRKWCMECEDWHTCRFVNEDNPKRGITWLALDGHAYRSPDPSVIARKALGRTQ